MDKVLGFLKKHKLNIIIFAMAIIAIILCTTLTAKNIRHTLCSHWLDTVEGICNEMLEKGYQTEDATTQNLEDAFGKLYEAGAPLEVVAFYRATGDGEAGDVLYSSLEECPLHSSVADFFKSLNKYSIYSKMMKNPSGISEWVRINGRSYHVVYYFVRDMGMNVIAFVPNDPIQAVTTAFVVGIVLNVLLYTVALLVFVWLSGKEKRALQKTLEDTLQTMRDKDTRSEILAYLMNEFTFEYNIVEDIMTLSQKYQTMFQRGKNFLRFRETLGFRYTIYHQDIEGIMSSFQEIMDGKEEGNIMFRLQMPGGNFEWFNAVYKVMYNSEHAPIYVIGKMMNVHQSQTEKERLLNKSTRDALTNLLNRSELEKRTTAYLESMDECDLGALLIMDLDHFKQVNDTFGHSKGDDLLRDVAAILRDTFRTSDIVGRLGGDEFYVFMKDVSNANDAVSKCEKLRQTLERSVTYENQSVNISSSMGIIFVKQGSNFLDIYMKADSALYRAKENGRNQVCIYSEENKSQN